MFRLTLFNGNLFKILLLSVKLPGLKSCIFQQVNKH